MLNLLRRITWPGTIAIDFLTVAFYIRVVSMFENVTFFPFAPPLSGVEVKCREDNSTAFKTQMYWGVATRCETCHWAKFGSISFVVDSCQNEENSN